MLSEGVLDLTKWTIEETKRLNEIYDIHYDEYLDFVDELSRKHIKDKFWWANLFPGNGHSVVKSYDRICQVLFAIEKSENDNVTQIRVSERLEREVLEQFFRNKGSDIEVLCSDKETIVEKRYYRVFLKNFLYLINEWKVVRKFGVKPQLEDEEYKMLITYIYPQNFESGEYVGKDFKNILEYTNENILFFPYYQVNKDLDKLKKLVLHINASKKYQFILKENYLKFGDYIGLLLLPLKCKKFCKEKKFFQGVDVSAIVNFDINETMLTDMSMMGLLNVKFCFRLKQAGVRLTRVVDWWESQPTNLLMLWKYKKCYSQGRYTAVFCHPLDKRYLLIRQSEVRKQAGIVPDRIAVPSLANKNIIAKKNEEFNIVMVPDFRIQKMFQYPVKKYSQKDRILLCALSYWKEKSSEALHILKNIEGIVEGLNIKVLIKNHPDRRGYGLQDYGISNFAFDYKVVDGDFFDSVAEAKAVFCFQTTSVFETIIYGAYPIILVTPGTIIHTNLPDEWENSYYSLAYGEDDLKQCLKLIYDGDGVKDSKDISKEELIPIASEETVRVLME